MLSRSQRLYLGQFNTVMEKGRVVHSSLFLVRILTNQPETRIAGVAPQKIAKTAVERNQMRRKIYHAIMHLKKDMATGTHAIIFAKAAALKLKPAEIRADIQALFVKAGVLR